MCVCVCVFDRQQSLQGYCGRLVGLVKMHVRKFGVTDVAFLLSHTNMVSLPLPASLILHIYVPEFSRFIHCVHLLMRHRKASDASRL